MTRRLYTLACRATLLALAVVLSGCMSFNPRSLRQMESALRASNPDMEFKSAMKFGVGPLTMDLVDFVFVHDGSIDVSKISRADIGIYELERPLASLDFNVPRGTDRSCPQREVILRVSAIDCAPDFVLAERLPIHGVLIPKVDSPAGVRGVAVRLEATWNTVAGRTDYPPAARELLGEATAAGVLL